MSDPNVYLGSGKGGTQVGAVNLVAQFTVDNTGGADAGAQINAALAAMMAAAKPSGQSAWLPDGAYLLTTAILNPNKIPIAVSPGATFSGANVASIGPSVLCAGQPANSGPGVIGFCSVGAAIFGGIDPTGVVDSSAAVQAAVNALAGTGIAAWIPPGTYLFDNYILLPSNCIIWASGSTTIKLNLSSGASFDAAFSAYPIADVAYTSTTVAAINTVGSKTVSSVASVAPGTWVQVGNVAPAAQQLFRSGIYQVQAVTGAGPFTLTMDRPVEWNLVVGDLIVPVISKWNALYAPTVHDIPRNIHIRGNGMKISGPAARYVEIQGTFDSTIDDLIFDSSLGAATVMWMSIDVASFNVVASRIHAIVPHGLALAGTLSFEATENCKYIDCTIEGEGVGDSVGYLGFDANSGSVWERCQVTGMLYGLNMTSGIPTSTPGCQRVTVNGGVFNGNVINGIQVGTNTVTAAGDVTIRGATCNDNATAGIWLDTVATGVKIIGCRLGSSKTAGTQTYAIALNSTGPGVGPVGCLASDCDFSGNAIDITGGDVDFVVTNVRSTNSATLFNWVGSTSASGTLFVTGFNVSGIANGSYSALGHVLGGTAVVTNGVATDATGGLALMRVDSGAVLKLADVRAYGTGGATTGLLVSAGGTVRIGPGVDLDGCSTPLSVASGGFCNRRQTVAGAPGGTAVAWPDLKSTDVIQLEPTAAVFTGYISARVAGTGFTVTDAASGTYEYTIV